MGKSFLECLNSEKRGESLGDEDQAKVNLAVKSFREAFDPFFSLARQLLAPGQVVSDVFLLVSKFASEDTKAQALERVTVRLHEILHDRRYVFTQPQIARVIRAEARRRGISEKHVLLEHLRSSIYGALVPPSGLNGAPLKSRKSGEIIEVPLSETEKCLQLRVEEQFLLSVLGKGRLKAERNEVAWAVDFEPSTGSSVENQLIARIQYKELERNLTKADLELLATEATGVPLIEYAEHQGMKPATARKRFERVKDKAKKILR